MLGNSVSADVDMGAPSLWLGTASSGGFLNEAFCVGTASSIGSAGPDTAGAVIELQYDWDIHSNPHVWVRLRTHSGATAWQDTGVYGFQNVFGTFTCRVDINGSGTRRR